MPSENLINQPDTILDTMETLAKRGATEIYCLEFVDYRASCKTFSITEKGSTVPVTGFFIRNTFKDAKAIADDGYARNHGVICIRRTPKKRGASYVFPGKIVDLSKEDAE